jgi:hypothetical protein
MPPDRKAGERSGRRKDRAGGSLTCYECGKDAASGGGRNCTRGSHMTLNKVVQGAHTQSHRVDAYQQTRQRKNGTMAGPKDLGNHAPPPPTTDKANISDAAHRLVELKQAVDVGRAALETDTPERVDRLAQVKERVAAGFYNSAEVRDQVAGKISTLFFDGALY